MNPKDLDSELTRLFEEQRRADEASAPDFRELMARNKKVAEAIDRAGATLARATAVSGSCVPSFAFWCSR